jgi:hypothetical protein
MLLRAMTSTACPRDVVAISKIGGAPIAFPAVARYAGTAMGTEEIPLSDRVEYWWVSYNAEVQPAEVTFRGGIPIHMRLIGSRDIIAAASIELMDRLPATPRPVLERARAPSPPARRKPTSPMWLIGIIVMTLLYWFSGQIFDAIK